MIKAFGVGRGAKKPPPPGDCGPGTAGDTGAPPPPAVGSGQRLPGEIRMQKELDELDLDNRNTKLAFPNPNDIMTFTLDLTPEEGYWKGACYKFTFIIPPLYPHEAPKVKCETLVYHPNIDFQGNVCLNILREEWKPVLSISPVIFGLMHLFLEPNPNDPLNQDAAKLLRDNKPQFEQTVYRTLRGYAVGGRQFPRLI